MNRLLLPIILMVVFTVVVAGCGSAHTGPYVFARGLWSFLLLEQNRVYNPATGLPARAFVPGTVQYTPRWSPDGQWVMYIIARDGLVDQGGLQISNVRGGELITVAEVGSWVRYPAWDPSGQSIIYYSRGAGSFVIESLTCRLARATCTDPAPKKLGIIGRSPTWAPKGDRIAYEDLDGRINILDLSTMEQQKVDLDLRSCHNPDWAPNQDALAVWCSDGKTLVVAILDLTSTPVQSRVLDFAGYCSRPTWSPDGQSIAFVCGGIDGLGEKLGIGDSATATNAVYVVDALFHQAPKRLSPSQNEEFVWVEWIPGP